MVFGEFLTICSLWAHLVTNVLLVSSLGVESPVQGSGEGLGSSQRPGPARWKQMPERDQKTVTQLGHPSLGDTRPRLPDRELSTLGLRTSNKGLTFPGQGHHLGLPDGSEAGIL